MEIHTQGAECPRDRRDRSRDRWDMSTGQMGHKPGGVPPNSLCLLVFFFPDQCERKLLSSKKNLLFTPPPQKNFVDFLFGFAWGFCIEKWRGLLVNFFWSPFPTKRSTKTPQKTRGKFGAKFGAKFGTKIRKIRALSFCDFSDQNLLHNL